MHYEDLKEQVQSLIEAMHTRTPRVLTQGELTEIECLIMMQERIRERQALMIQRLRGLKADA